MADTFKTLGSDGPSDDLMRSIREQVDKILREQVDKILREDNAVLERACEMSLLDPQQRGVLVNRETGEVSLSSKVPYGSMYEILPELRNPMVRLWMKEEGNG